MDLISAADRDNLERHLAGVLDRCFSEPAARPLSRCVADYVLAGGKRLRPQLCLWTYEKATVEGRSLKVESGRQSAFDLACVWELFHAFLLAHDDVIDNSDRRRDRPSLHFQLAQLDSGSIVFGKNLAIVAGDLLFSAAMKLLADIDLPAETYRQVQKLFSRIACTTGFGQVLDICQSHVPLDDVEEAVLMREYDWKTAAYTFEGPMLSGAMLAGACEQTQSAVSRFAVSIGQAYQLHNDLLDLAAPVHDGCDLIQGKRTVTLMRARATMPSAQRKAFDQRFLKLQPQAGRTAVASDELATAEALRQELHACGAIDQTRQLIEQCARAAAESLQTPQLPPALRSGLAGLLDELQSRYFVRV